MDQRRSSGSRPERVPVPAQVRKNAYQHQEEPRYHGKAPATGGEEMSYVPARSNSHRRRDSQLYYALEELPAAPDAPRGGPPLSYKDSVGPSASAPVRRRSDPKSYSSRIATQPPNIDTGATRHRDPPFEPVSPEGQATSSSMRLANPKDRVASGETVARRGSVPDRSPLQKLEGKLGDISKEEKRARIAEAEIRAREARERSDAKKQRSRQATRDALERTTGGSEQQNLVPSRSDKPRRAATMPVRGNMDPGPVRDPEREHAPSHHDQTVLPPPRRSQTQRSVSGPSQQVPYAVEPVDQYAPQPRKSVSTKPRPSSGRHDYEHKEPRTPPQGALATGAAGATGLGLYASQDSPNQYHAHESPNVTVARSGSKKLQKQPPRPNSYVSRDPGPSSAPTAPPPQRTVSQGYDPAYPPKPSVTSTRTGPLHEMSQSKHRDAPLPAPMARDNHLVPPKQPGQHHHHFLHRHDEPERRYQKTPTIEEFRRAGTATLVIDDFRLDNAAPKAGVDNDPWWEKSTGSQRRRHSGQAAAAPYDTYEGPYKDETGRTLFNPPLYLKSGPLLRYCGIQREQTTARNGELLEHETWRGTIMIVTIDNQSTYTTPPTLRLFSSPTELPPPPPTHLDATNGQQLAPEYVDPIAGAIKGSRIGKTLYVRPVEYLPEGIDLSRVEDDSGLFEETPSPPPHGQATPGATRTQKRTRDGDHLGRYREVRAVRLHAERGVTFWRFHLGVELGTRAARVAYRINRGPAIPFWVPARGESMNIMFSSCNGFSVSVDPREFGGPDPLWRDVLNAHTLRPFHVMVGGGDQVYNDRATVETERLAEWCAVKRPGAKEDWPFSAEMQEELEEFYLNRYAMWFSQGLFGMAAGMIPMVNIWDDHDIIDGFGSYPHHFMSSPVFSGIGNVAYKYYMLFQHHSLPQELEKDEPSWILGAEPGPYIQELSRNLFLSFGKQIAFLGLDCRTERMRDSVLTQETYDLVFDRLDKEIVRGETKHLIVLLGVPIAYPRLNFLENVLTSRVMDPVKALGRTGKLGNFVNKFDGGVEILDDLDDHWTAKHHKHERNWLIQELQEFAAENSIRITILGGDVHLAAVGQFYSNKKLGIPKDKDHRYMPNIVSSSIVNTPPPDLLADVLNRRNKIHHLDPDTDEDMIPLFPHDSDGKPRNNKTLLPRRNWCAIREYQPGSTPPPTPPPISPADQSPSRSRSESRGRGITRSLSLTRGAGSLVRRLSGSRKRAPADREPQTERPTRSVAPPRAFFNHPSVRESENHPVSSHDRAHSAEQLPPRRPSDASNSYFPEEPFHPGPFHRRPTNLSEKSGRRNNLARRDSHPFTNHGDGLPPSPPGDHINLQSGLDITLNVEVSRGDPAGITHPYRLLVPALWYSGPPDINPASRNGRLKTLFASLGRRRAEHSRTSGLEDGAFDSRATTPRGVSRAGASEDISEGYGRERYGEESEPASRPPKKAGGLFRSLTGRFGSKRIVGPPPPYTPGGREDGYSFEEDRDERVAGRVDEYRGTGTRRAPQPVEVPRGMSATARVGPDGRPIRRSYRGDAYDAGIEDTDEEGEETPRLGEVESPYGGARERESEFYGKGGFEEGERKRGGWRLWK
ncbi:hypothetical protein P152DRAFT_513105 [Eremomyces bilateralis CBS 781.70]|uniref:PhoD-like phosphatase domain-containing protein n=1 Tax=Eremomyces bilateralis CBS 781.70 TaxID=1392243 RepID=A0A6G1G6R2_9PEZI|nr:uncharacterized protein P152DRAFT_513105 [Eremomyces bilateralis CBS 781.70]KAF1813712.1 hypothetical protein P152DRAFT_513105 [Eremomyces bilateralis CBS 781.70]